MGDDNQEVQGVFMIIMVVIMVVISVPWTLIELELTEKDND